jgi:hypothetical protein
VPITNTSPEANIAKLAKDTDNEVSTHGLMFLLRGYQLKHYILTPVQYKLFRTKF